jgi:hypothetical protein
MSALGEILNYGRLTCRLFIVAFCHDICCANPSGDDDVVLSLLNLNHETWVNLKDRLVLIRRMLLAKDADLYVLPGGDEAKPPPANSEVDERKEHLAMFGENFADLLLKFLVQIAIAKFRENLSSITPELGNHTPLVKTIEAAVDEYKATLTDDVFKGDRVPSSLTSFLLQDLYQSNREEIGTLPSKLKEDVEKILLDESHPYSYRMLQVDVRTLLKRWHSSLSTPELVRRGYGGVREILVEDDNRSVSSWGADEQLTGGKQLLPQPLDAAAATDEDCIDGDHDENTPMETVTTAIEPIPHDSFDEEPLAALQQVMEQVETEQTAEQIEGIPAERGDDTEPLLQRETDSRRPDSTTHEESEVPSVTPSQSGSRKRKSSPENGHSTKAQQRFRNQPLRLDGFMSSDDEFETETLRSRVETKRPPPPRSLSRTKRFFTPEETQAVRDGVRRFGPGNWTTIKWNCNGRLQNRSTVQIKDKYRNMVQKGEI